MKDDCSSLLMEVGKFMQQIYMYVGVELGTQARVSRRGIYIQDQICDDKGDRSSLM